MSQSIHLAERPWLGVGRPPESAEKRFWRKVDKSGGPDACWPWLASTHPGGYGQFYDARNKPIYAHRFAWILEYGDIEENRDPIYPFVLVLHSCDNPPCVNIKHLFLGTSSHNRHDMMLKKRGNFASGEQNGQAVLSSEQVIEIYTSLESRSILARKFNVHINHIDKIKKGKRWKKLTSNLLANSLPTQGRDTL